jgi:hypothetical protein
MKNLCKISFDRVKKALKRIKEQRKMNKGRSILPRTWNGVKAQKNEQLCQDNSKMTPEDFTIYEDLADYEFCQQFESRSESLNRYKSNGSYNDFDAFLNEIKKEEEKIFVNIVFMDHLKLAKQEIDDGYELVTFKNK